MNYQLMKKIFALALLLACGLTATEQEAFAQQTSTPVAAAAAAQSPASPQVQLSDVPLMGTLSSGTQNVKVERHSALLPTTPQTTPQSRPVPQQTSPVITPPPLSEERTTMPPPQAIPSNAGAETRLAVPSIAPDYRATLAGVPPALERVGVNMAEQRPLALREAIELALKNGKDIEVARTNVRAAEFDLTAAR